MRAVVAEKQTDVTGTIPETAEVKQAGVSTQDAHNDAGNLDAADHAAAANQAAAPDISGSHVERDQADIQTSETAGTAVVSRNVKMGSFDDDPEAGAKKPRVEMCSARLLDPDTGDVVGSLVDLPESERQKLLKPEKPDQSGDACDKIVAAQAENPAEDRPKTEQPQPRRMRRKADLSLCPQDDAQVKEFEIFYSNRYGASVKFLAKLNVPFDEVEDVLADAYIRAFTGWNGFRDGTNRESWFTTIVRNSANNYWRAKKFQRVPPMADSGEVVDIALATEIDQDLPIEDQIEAIDQVEQLRAILRKNGMNDLQIDALHHSDLPYTDYASLRGIPSSVIRGRLYRARQIIAAKNIRRMVLAHYTDD